VRCQTFTTMRLIGAILAVVGASFLTTGSLGAQAPDGHIANYAFVPDTFQIAAGSTLTIINDDNDMHTISSPGNFDSGPLYQGDTWSYTFDTPGTYNFSCIPHPWMTGRIIVQ